MQSLFDPRDRDALLQRLASLAPASPRQWGKMSVSQMLAHLAATMEVACGDHVKKQRLIGRILAPFVMSSALGEKPFTRNAPTDPEYRITDDRDFAAERQRVAALVERFAGQAPGAVEGRVHSFFGPLSAEDWGRLMGKHLDHHLRQFGV
jgi:hypothetical protein